MFSPKKVSLALFVIVFIFHQGLGAPRQSKYAFLDRSFPAQNILEKNLIGDDDDDNEWCDPVLGCLEMTNDWKGSVTRPTNPMPDTREKINTMFYLHTRAEPNNNTDYVVSADNLTSLENSPFDVSKPTKFLVHGYLDSGNENWLKELAAEMLIYGDYNVLRVDWGHGANKLYPQSVANSRVVGLEIKHFVSTLVSTLGLNPANVHCIGHSLGAHVCGYSSDQINKIGRITGLDPAGPYFTDTPDFVHLDPSDAMFVDNIHTNGNPIYESGYGTSQPMGNIDFFPNSGLSQPGCGILSTSMGVNTNKGKAAYETRSSIACSHHRAISYFQESLSTSSSQWIGQECQDYDTYEAGECYSCGDDGSQCAYLGMRADEYVSKSRKFATFYLDTDKQSPFCTNQYKVDILTAHPEEAESAVYGKLYLTVHGDNSQIIEEVEITKDQQKIDHGKIFKTVFTSHIDIGHAIKIEVKWVYDSELLHPGSYCWSSSCNTSLYVQSIQLTPMNHYPESERLSYTTVACNLDESMTKIEDKSTQSFMVSNKCQALTK